MLGAALRKVTSVLPRINFTVRATYEWKNKVEKLPYSNCGQVSEMLRPKVKCHLPETLKHQLEMSEYIWGAP